MTDSLFSPSTNPPTPIANSLTLVSGISQQIPVTAYGEIRFQLAGVNLDTISITHSLDGTNFINATLEKDDGQPYSGATMTGSSVNGIYTVTVFGGILNITRTGSADTNLAFTYKTLSTKIFK